VDPDPHSIRPLDQDPALECWFGSRFSYSKYWRPKPKFTMISEVSATVTYKW
jgi:hypothetical protein